MTEQEDPILAKARKLRAAGATVQEVEQYLASKGYADGKPQFDNVLTTPRPAAKTEAGKDFVTGASQGASFNFGDEIAAGTMAALGQLFGAKLPIGEAYKKLHGEAEDEVKAAAERSPFLSTTGNIAGAVIGGAGGGAAAEALGFSRGAASIPATIKQFLMRKGRDVGVAAGAGAVAGAGAGDEGHRLESAGKGALFGGGLVAGGNLASGALKATGVPALVRNLAPRAETNASTMGKVGEKLRVGSHQQVAIEDLLADIRRSGMTVGDYLKRARANPNAALYDLGPSMNTTLGSVRAKVNPQGDPLVRRARGAQSVPSRGSSEISDFTNARAESRPGEVKDALEEGLGVGRENTVAREAQLTKTRGVEAAKNYGPIRDKVIDDPEVLSLFDEPEFQALHKVVRDDARLRRLPEVPELKSESRIISAAEGASPRDVLNPQTLGTLDKMKQFADDIVAGRIDGGAIQKTQASAMSARLKDIRDRLDELHPEYGAARGEFADASREIEASQLGNDFWKTRGDELEVKWPTLSPSAQQEYRKTALAAIEERLGGGMNPAQLLNEVNARKLRMLAGSPAAYQEFEKKLRMTLQGGANDAMIMGGSPTARILAEQGDAGADAAGAIGAAMHASTGNVRGVMDKILQNSAARRVRGLNEAKVDQMAPFLTARGTDLVTRLEQMQNVEKLLADFLSKRGVRNATVAGQVGGTMGGKR
jgi:hypothetical protein